MVCLGEVWSWARAGADAADLGSHRDLSATAARGRRGEHGLRHADQGDQGRLRHHHQARIRREAHRVRPLR